MFIEIPDKNIEESLCYLRSVKDMLIKYSKLTNEYIDVEIAEINCWINTLQSGK